MHGKPNWRLGSAWDLGHQSMKPEAEPVEPAGLAELAEPDGQAGRVEPAELAEPAGPAPLIRNNTFQVNGRC